MLSLYNSGFELIDLATIKDVNEYREFVTSSAFFDKFSYTEIKEYMEMNSNLLIEEENKFYSKFYDSLVNGYKKQRASNLKSRDLLVVSPKPFLTRVSLSSDVITITIKTPMDFKDVKLKACHIAHFTYEFSHLLSKTNNFSKYFSNIGEHLGLRLKKINLKDILVIRTKNEIVIKVNKEKMYLMSALILEVDKAIALRLYARIGIVKHTVYPIAKQLKQK